MASPAFIYAFDNLGPYRFTELCGLLLGSRYKGFLLGGIGSDGGIDAEIDSVLSADKKMDDIFGIWQPEIKTPINNDIIEPQETVIFQFKHIVAARAGGETKARQKLLSMYKGQANKKSEVLNNLILEKQPTTYILITNVEVNSNFRSEFVSLCKAQNPNIKNYQIIGLDELEAMVTLDRHLRHLYFPTIFGESRFNLKLEFRDGVLFQNQRHIDVYILSIMNIGIAPSYISGIYFEILDNGERKNVFINIYEMKLPNNKIGSVLEPGRKHTFYYPHSITNDMRNMENISKNLFLTDIVVVDEIGNEYRTEIPDYIRERIIGKDNEE